MSKSNLDYNIQTNTTGRLTPCLQQKIDKTRYLVEVHFSAASTQSVEEKLKRVILHDLVLNKQSNCIQRYCWKNDITWGRNDIAGQFNASIAKLPVFKKYQGLPMAF